MHEISEDIRELLRLFHQHGVEFLICGGHAVAFYGHVRLTFDLDILIRPTADNAARVSRALDDFGFGNAGIPVSAFEQPGTAVTLGVQPNQVDLLTSMSSENTDAIFASSRPGRLAGLDVAFVSRAALLRAKREADRPKDRADIHELERLEPDSDD